jgi:hypothetical protein
MPSQWSTPTESPPGHAHRAAQPCTISVLLVPAHKTWQASNPPKQDLSSAGPCPSSLPSQPSTDIHHLCQATPSPCLHRPVGSQPGCAPHTFTGLHDLHWAALLMHVMHAQACMISMGTMPLKLAKVAICRHTWSPLCQAMPFGHTKPTSKGQLVRLNESLLPIGLWDPTHLLPTTGGLLTYQGDTHREVCILKE